MIRIVTPTTLPAHRPRQGFAPDISRGFDLRASERMTYLGPAKAVSRPPHWRVHRFVTFDGRLVRTVLPPDARLYVWPVGKGPQPKDSVCSRRRIWGRVAENSLHALSPAELRAYFRLWRSFGPALPWQAT